MIHQPSLFGKVEVEMYHEYDPEADIILYPGNVRDLLKDMPDESVHLIVTSPPYNIGKEYEVRKKLDTYLAQQREIIEELYRVLREDGSICWEVGNYVEDNEIYPLDIYFYDIFKQLGMQLRNRVVWHFGHGLHARNRFSGRYETLLWFTKCQNYTFNLDNVRVPSKYPGKRSYKGADKGLPSGNIKGKNPSDRWEFMLEEWERGLWNIPNVKANHPEKTSHPAQYPIELAERCVLAMSNPGDVVFDPYVGVGTSIIAAIKHERKAIGAEKEKEYVEIAKERIQNYYGGTLRIRPLGKPVYKPSGKIARVPKEWISKRDIKEQGMRIAGVYSFNEGLEVMERNHRDELQEIYSVLNAIEARGYKNKVSEEETTAGEVFYSPSDLNAAIRSGFATFGWDVNVRVSCDYPTEYYVEGYTPPDNVGRGAYREMDFIKGRVGIEVQFGKYSFMVYNVAAKMTIFHNLDLIDVGVEIVPVKEMAGEMSSGVSYFEQFLWDLDHRGVSDIDIPVLILGVAPAVEQGEE